MTERLEFDQILPRIADLAEQLADHKDPEVVDVAGELLDWIDVFHANGVGRMVEMLRNGEATSCSRPLPRIRLRANCCGRMGSVMMSTSMRPESQSKLRWPRSVRTCIHTAETWKSCTSPMEWCD